MESNPTSVPTYNDDKSKPFQDSTKQPVLNHQTLSSTSKSSKDLSDSEADPKDNSNADGTAAKKSKGRKIKDAGATLATGALTGLGHLLEAIN